MSHRPKRVGVSINVTTVPTDGLPEVRVWPLGRALQSALRAAGRGRKGGVALHRPGPAGEKVTPPLLADTFAFLLFSFRPDFYAGDTGCHKQAV